MRRVPLNGNSEVSLQMSWKRGAILLQKMEIMCQAKNVNVWEWYFEQKKGEKLSRFLFFVEVPSFTEVKVFLLRVPRLYLQFANCARSSYG